MLEVQMKREKVLEVIDVLFKALDIVELKGTQSILLKDSGSKAGVIITVLPESEPYSEETNDG